MCLVAVDRSRSLGGAPQRCSAGLVSLSSSPHVRLEVETPDCVGIFLDAYDSGQHSRLARRQAFFTFSKPLALLTKVARARCCETMSAQLRSSSALCVADTSWGGPAAVAPPAGVWARPAVQWRASASAMSVLRLRMIPARSLVADQGRRCPPWLRPKRPPQLPHRGRSDAEAAAVATAGRSTTRDTSTSTSTGSR